jgi:hypothetical protein
MFICRLAKFHDADCTLITSSNWGDIMRKMVIISVVLLLSISILETGNAALQNNGNNFIYDTDLNITWYAVANNTAMHWYDANTWATSQIYGGVSGWRLPTTPGTSSGYSNEGEMGHLYYDELGNQTGGPLTNVGPFTNLRADLYWTGTEIDTFHAWYYAFLNGSQGDVDKGLYPYFYGALAVHDGNVSAVPLPGAVWLLSSGLIGLIGIRRFKK